MRVHPASVTNAVHRLEFDGLVSRRSNPVDGRGVLAQITPRGKKLAEQATSQLNAEVFSVVPVPAAEQREIYTMLKGMRLAFGDFDESR